MHGTIRSRGTRTAILVGLAMAIYGLLVKLFSPEIEALDAPLGGASIAIGAGLLLGLRINRAYERWWEARTLWGSLVNLSRNLAAKVHAYAEPSAAEAQHMAKLIAGFAFALKMHLRDGGTLQTLDGFAAETDKPDHVPFWMARQIFDQLGAWEHAGRLSSQELWPLDEEARGLMNVCGACERIRNTPMPPSLAGLSRLTMLLAAAILPWVLHDDGTAWAIAGATGIATFFLFIVETTATVIEAPFGLDVNQLRLGRLCRGIDASVREALGVSAQA